MPMLTADEIRDTVARSPEIRRSTCRACPEPIAYLTEGQFGVTLSGWVHAATGKFLGTNDPNGIPHGAYPPPQCPACKGPNYVHSQTMWGDNYDCTDCGSHHYVSLGD
jgi:hypothetical protein